MSLVMKGLEQYIAKHGRHFTEELAYDIMGSMWSFEEIDTTLQKRVYYNVSGMTSGDIVYYVNGMGWKSKGEMLYWLIPDLLEVGLSEELFSAFLLVRDQFDFTPYI